MPSLRTIAVLAGCSAMTVSRVLRGLPVQAESRRKVLQVVEYFQRLPDQQVSQLLKQSGGLLGVIIPSLHSPFVTRLLQGIYQAAYAVAYHIVLLESHWSLPETERALYAMIEHQVSGVLILSGQLAPLSREAIQAVHAAQIVPVCLGPTHAALPTDSVQTDETRMAALAVEYLWNLGHRRLAYIGERQTTRYRAFQRQCAHFGCQLVCCEVHGLPLYWYGESAADPVFQQLAACDPAPTALVAGNGYLAAQLLRWAWEQGMHIPHVCSILGCGDLPLYANLIPPLSTVEQYPERIGQEAVTLAVRRIQQQSIHSPPARSSPDTVTIAPDLVIRASCGPPPK